MANKWGLEWYRKDKIEKSSMVQDDSEAYIYNASFDNDFNTDYFNEF